MLQAFQIDVTPNYSTELEVILTFEERQKSRYKTTLRDGSDLGWFIERGVVLCDGDVLLCETGEKIRVVAAPESVSQVESDDQLALTRVAYHLGNRHVPLQIGDRYLRYQHDHVLDNMVVGLGLNVSYKQLPFQPENGAYHGQHSHSHDHSQHPDHKSHHHEHHHGHAHNVSHPHESGGRG